MADFKLEKGLLIGIRAAKDGDKERAQQFLKDVLRQDRTMVLAWIWLGYAANNARERRACLEKVLKLHPRNKYAIDAYNIAKGSIAADKDAPIQWDAMALLALRHIDIESDSVRESLNGLFQIAEPPPPPRVKMMRALLTFIAFSILVNVFVPALRPWNLLDAFLPDNGDADVVFVRVVPAPVQTYEDDAPIQEFVLGDGFVIADHFPVEGEIDDESSAWIGDDPFDFTMYDVGESEVAPPPNNDRWLIEVTIEHENSANSFANGWDVILPNGIILRDDRNQEFTRTILRPDPAPRFTTSRFVWLPYGTSHVVIRAHDSDGGYGGREVVVDFTTPQSNEFEIVMLD